MILKLQDGHGCAYTIDDEGTLYYIPLTSKNNLNLDELAEVDLFNMDEDDRDDVSQIHNDLIALAKTAATYYQN
jgi:hypothetical protein